MVLFEITPVGDSLMPFNAMRLHFELVCLCAYGIVTARNGSSECAAAQ
jgi:hypothetical protein